MCLWLLGDEDMAGSSFDTSKSLPESNAVVKGAAAALESGDTASYNLKLSRNDRDSSNDTVVMPDMDQPKFISGLKTAKVVEAYPGVVYYEMTVDGKTYEFSTRLEGGEWKIVF